MTHKRIGNSYLLRFDKGEELVRTLSQFLEEKDIKSGWISGLGGALWAELAFYHLDQKAYEFDRIDEPLEVSNLTGNITLFNGKPFVHIHATVSDLNYHSYAGHLKELGVAATLELKIDVLEEPIERVQSDAVGLKVLDL
ncbi:MAG TPA: DUF296 domain-containing protein [Candidatus Saccharimonadales bacterium]